MINESDFESEANPIDRRHNSKHVSTREKRPIKDMGRNNMKSNSSNRGADLSDSTVGSSKMPRKSNNNFLTEKPPQSKQMNLLSESDPSMTDQEDEKNIKGRQRRTKSDAGS